jgi:hypothetical protein
MTSAFFLDSDKQGVKGKDDGSVLDGSLRERSNNTLRKNLGDIEGDYLHY